MGANAAGIGGWEEAIWEWVGDGANVWVWGGDGDKKLFPYHSLVVGNFSFQNFVLCFIIKYFCSLNFVAIISVGV